MNPRLQRVRQLLDAFERNGDLQALWLAERLLNRVRHDVHQELKDPTRSKHPPQRKATSDENA